MIKYFCDDCGRQIEIDAHPLDVEEGGEGVDIFYYDLGTETHSYDKRSDERTQHHQCKLCHINEHQEESFYFNEVYMADAILKKVEEIEEAKKRKPDKADDYVRVSDES